MFCSGLFGRLGRCLFVPNSLIRIFIQNNDICFKNIRLKTPDVCMLPLQSAVAETVSLSVLDSSVLLSFPGHFWSQFQMLGVKEQC